MTIRITDKLVNEILEENNLKRVDALMQLLGQKIRKVYWSYNDVQKCYENPYYNALETKLRKVIDHLGNVKVSEWEAVSDIVYNVKVCDFLA